MLNPLKANILLEKCTGREIWSLELCRQEGIPESWIEELQQCYESGFRSDRQTIYENDRVVNQYEGLRDLDIAYKLAAYLGVDVELAVQNVLSPEAEVRALKEAVEEM